MTATASITVPRQVTPLTAEQEQRFLARFSGAQASVEHLLLRLRLDADVELAPRIPYYGKKPYPVGRCLEIRNAVFLRLQAELNDRQAGTGDDRAALDLLRRYLSDGGFCTKLWGSLRNEYFQNAIQLGAWYIDVANDTVVATKPKIEILPMASSGFSNIGDYRHFVDIARRYWQVEIFANTLFPRMAPLYPLICVKDQQHAWLAAGYAEMVELTRREAFLPSEIILQQLPPAPDYLRSRFAGRWSADQPLLALEGDPVAACRDARAQGLMTADDYRKAVIVAFNQLCKR